LYDNLHVKQQLKVLYQLIVILEDNKTKIPVSTSNKNRLSLTTKKS